MKYIFILPLLLTLALGAPATYDQRQDGEVNVRADLQNFVVIALVPKLGGSGSMLLDALTKTIQARKGLRNSNRRHQHPEPEQTEEDQDTADPRVAAEPFLKSKSTYHVDISEAKSNLANVYRAESKSSLSPASKSAFSTNPKLAERKQSVESPIPDVLPVKDNRYVMAADRNGKIVQVINLSDNVENDSDVSDKGVTEKATVSNESEDGSRGMKDSGLLLLGAMEQCGPDLYRDNAGICQLLKSTPV